MTEDEAKEARAALAYNIITARQRRGWTQDEMAQATGLSQQKISSIERGTENVTMRTLGRLAVALGVRPWALLRRTGKK